MRLAPIGKKALASCVRRADLWMLGLIALPSCLTDHLERVGNFLTGDANRRRSHLAVWQRRLVDGTKFVALIDAISSPDCSDWSGISFAQIRKAGANCLASGSMSVKARLLNVSPEKNSARGCSGSPPLRLEPFRSMPRSGATFSSGPQAPTRAPVAPRCSPAQLMASTWPARCRRRRKPTSWRSFLSGWRPRMPRPVEREKKWRETAPRGSPIRADFLSLSQVCVRLLHSSIDVERANQSLSGNVESGVNFGSFNNFVL